MDESLEFRIDNAIFRLEKEIVLGKFLLLMN